MAALSFHGPIRKLDYFVAEFTLERSEGLLAMTIGGARFLCRHSREGGNPASVRNDAGSPPSRGRRYKNREWIPAEACPRVFKSGVGMTQWSRVDQAWHEGKSCQGLASGH